MSSPIAARMLPPASPPLTPEPIIMVPRNKYPRTQPPSSQAQTPSKAALLATSPPKSRPAPSHSYSNPTPMTSTTRETAASSASSAGSSRSLPGSVAMTTPSTSAGVALSSKDNIPMPISGGAIGAIHPLYKKGGGVGSSSASVSGIGGGGGVGPGSAAVQMTPQTGASKMAAAAKRGQAGIQEVGPQPPEDEDHPLSEKCLRARDYQTLHTMNRLFHVPSRWKLIRSLGQGAYGLVIQVQDSISGEPVAIKCITRVFDKVILARRALREITLLRHFGGHENLTGLIDLDHVWEGYNEIYLYMEPMEADLHQIVRSGQPLSNAHIQYFLYQLLRGMKFMHSANVIHRDLKPGNLLVNADCELKICDFGLARGFRPVEGEDPQNSELKLTEYVATRWYRAPEVMLSNKRYTTAIDVWSIGCILAELMGGKPLFKGKDYVDQLNLILEVLGTPDNETLERIGSEKACIYIRSLPRSEPVPLQTLFPQADYQSVDLLRQLLAFDPAKRITVPEALAHSYMATYHDPMDEPECPSLFEKWELVESLSTIEELREAISKEIEEYRAEVRAAPFEDEDDEEGEYAEEEDTLRDGDTVVPSPAGQTPMIGNGSAKLWVAEDPNIPEAGPSSSPKQSLHDIGLTPRIAGTALPTSVVSKGREREYREREKNGLGFNPAGTATPPTPASALSEESFSAGPPSSSHAPLISGTSGIKSRRSSGHSIGRRPNSFLFNSGFGGGMTPLQSITALPPSGQDERGRDRDREVISSGSTSGTGISAGYYRPPRSRAPSSTGEFANLRPLIRQLSIVGLDQSNNNSHKDHNGGYQGGGGTGRAGGTGGSGTGNESGKSAEVPPMTVSPSDAPPSEAPKSFGQVSRPPSVPPPLPADQAE